MVNSGHKVYFADFMDDNVQDLEDNGYTVKYVGVHDIQSFDFVFYKVYQISKG